MKFPFNYLTTLGVVIFASKLINAQNFYDKGYIISKAGDSIDCYILYKDWSSNPSSFVYKRNMDGAEEYISASDIKDLQIGNFCKYSTFTVNVDTSASSAKPNLLSNEYRPLYVKKTLLLKVLIEGNASLYQLKMDNRFLYFYKLNGDTIIPLVYKEYITNQNTIRENKYYKQQLSNQLNCDQAQTYLTHNEVLYTEGSLRRYFEMYNECMHAQWTKYQYKNKTKALSISIKGGIGLTSITANSSFLSDKKESFTTTHYKVGLEVECLLPMNNNRWALMLEPSYTHLKDENNSIKTNTINSIRVNALQIPLGLRYYMFLDKEFKLFLSPMFLVNSYLNNSKLVYSDAGNTELDFKTTFGFGLGAGLKYNDKFSAELRLTHVPNYLINYSYWDGKMSYFSIIFGYKIF